MTWWESIVCISKEVGHHAGEQQLFCWTLWFLCIPVFVKQMADNWPVMYGLVQLMNKEEIVIFALHISKQDRGKYLDIYITCNVIHM